MGYEMDSGFDDEMNLVTLLTIVAIFLIVLITFRTVVGSAALVAIIQGAVFITTAVVALTGAGGELHRADPRAVHPDGRDDRLRHSFHQPIQGSARGRGPNRRALHCDGPLAADDSDVLVHPDGLLPERSGVYDAARHLDLLPSSQAARSARCC